MDQEASISKLKNDLASGRVVTITGTGVSLAACGNQEVVGHKVASWTGLLQHGVQHCRDKGLADDDDVELLTQQIKSGKTTSSSWRPRTSRAGSIRQAVACSEAG